MKTHVMSIGEFMNPEPKVKVKKKQSMEHHLAALSTVVPLYFGMRMLTAHATEPEAVAVNALTDKVKGTVIHAFDPLIDLVIALSYPIAGVMIAAGSLFVMIGNKEKGYSMITTAAIGYILVQLSPMMMDLLVQIGNEV